MVESPWLLLLLFSGALAAGWVDSIAGGGGLVTIPLLLWVGLPPQLALGTNKFQASFGSFTATYYYVHKGVVPLRQAVPGIIFTLIGAALGTWAVQQISGDVLNGIIPFLLLGIAVYTLFTPSLGMGDHSPRMSRSSFFALFGLLLGAYDGFFGPGVGSFWAVAFVLALGLNLTTATGYTKLMNFTSNIVSCLLFALGGHVLPLAGAVMAVGQILGARLGSGMVVRRGARFIRPVFVSMVILTTLKLMYDRFF
ncbi:MAG: TSUP family transporter [Bacteroidota bacterium]